jgi:hypothetical protein
MEAGPLDQDKYKDPVEKKVEIKHWWIFIGCLRIRPARELSFENWVQRNSKQCRNQPKDSESLNGEQHFICMLRKSYGNRKTCQKDQGHEKEYCTLVIKQHPEWSASEILHTIVKRILTSEPDPTQALKDHALLIPLEKL